MTKEEALVKYCLRIADDSLILGQQLGAWCGHGPILEEDIALTNVALDILGQSRTLYQYAAQVKGGDATEDSLAFQRSERAYYNVQLVEQPNGDYAMTIARQFFFDAFRKLYYTELMKSRDITLKGLAEKSIKETDYHYTHSSDWVKRFGDGTEESHERIATAINALWMFTDELFYMDEVDEMMIKEGIGVDLAPLKPKWEAMVNDVLTEATLQVPESNWMQSGGRKGVHTEHMGYILADLQYMQHTYPGLDW